METQVRLDITYFRSVVEPVAFAFFVLPVVADYSFRTEILLFNDLFIISAPPVFYVFVDLLFLHFS